MNSIQPGLTSFRVHLLGKMEVITTDQLYAYADACFLNLYAKGRYSWLFVLNLMFYERLYGINPFQVVDEIKALEEDDGVTRTKPASQFTREPLQGLWHKHFFSARFMAHNLSNHLAGDKLTKLVEEIFDPKKSPVVTEQMVMELAHRVTVESFESRANAGKLTGEWIVFSKHEEKNYYLCLATHNSDDHSIYKNIKAVCLPQFPFLSSLLF